MKRSEKFYVWLLMLVSIRSYEKSTYEEALLLFKFFVRRYMNDRQRLTIKNETEIKS